MRDYKDFLVGILDWLCKKPFTVKEIDGEDVIVFEVKLDGSEMGKVLGRRGTIADAIRTLMYAANPTDKRVVIQFVEQKG